MLIMSKLEGLEGDIQSSEMELDKMSEALKMSEAVINLLINK